MEGNMSSSSSSSGAHSANPQAIKRRRRTTKHELQVLEDLYAESRNPSLEARQKACDAIGFEMKALQVWLQNRRQKEKKDAGKWKPAYTATGESAATSSTTTNAPSSTIHSSYSHSAASSRSSSTSPDVSFHHAPLHPSHLDHPRVNKQHSAFSTSLTTEDNAIRLPPMLLNTIPPQSSPLVQLPLTLPSISSVIAESSSRDFNHHHHASNKLSPMLRQDENTFVRPPFQRTTSADSARSCSTSSSSVRPDVQVHTQQTALSKPIVASTLEAPPQFAAARPIKALRRASSTYSLSMTEDGKAQMLVTEVPQINTQKPQLPSLATAILASSPSITSPSTITSAGSDGSQFASSASSVRKFSSALASAPLSSYNRQALPSSKSNSGRVYSLPSLSTLSNNSATASLKSHNHSNTIFSGGSRLGSPPKKTVHTTTTSHNTDSRQKRIEKANKSTDQNELWMNLDSDPVEPEDEVIMNQNRRMLDSPVKRFTSVKMEDVISCSSSSSSPQSSSSVSRKRKYIAMKESEVSKKGNDIAQGYSGEKITSLGGAGFVAVTLQATDASAPEGQNPASNNARASPFIRSATTANILSSTNNTAILSSPSKSSISSFQAQLSLQGSLKQIQSRKRSYSKTMLSRSISLDRVILHDDSTDEENSPQKKSTTNLQLQQPRSAGLYPTGTILGRPLLSRANSHLGILHSSTPREVSTKEQPIKRTKLDHLDLVSSSLPINARSNDVAAGNADVVMATIEDRKTPSSPLDVSLAETSLGEPELSFSTEASQSFDDTSREGMSDLAKPSEMIAEAPILDMMNEKIHTSTITSTPYKKQGNTLALAALKGHMSSPIKLRSPNKKILTEVERDCAAVLCGLGFPDIF